MPSIRSLIRCALLALGLSGLSHVAWAQFDAGDGPHVKVELIAETGSAVPGEKLQLALVQHIDKGWHTYWINPGDAGLPTTIDWTLPEGFAADPIQWPVPKRIVYGELVSYGYENEVLLPVTIDVPANAAPGKNITLSGHANWLVCSEVCIPEESDISLTLPVTAGPARLDTRRKDAFAAARAAMPIANPFDATASATDDAVTLHVATGDASKLTDIVFFPGDDGVTDNDTPPRVEAGRDGVTVTFKRGAKKPEPLHTLNGVLTFRDGSAGAPDSRQAIAISAPVTASAGGAAVRLGLIEAVLLALLGGVVLNLMPCVLPVLSLKAMSLVAHAKSAPREVRLQGLAYGAGVLISFGLVAGALIGLRAAGGEIGWGFQLQSPVFVTLMIYVLFAVGLSLSGVFTVGDGIVGVGGSLAGREGYAGSFFTGALATLVATPCTAPFMAAAIGFAITQPWYVSLIIFESIGLGLALPYLLLAFSPGARRFLPKPGAWMDGLKHFLAFPVYGTAVWLAFVLTSESGSFGIAAALAGLVLIAFAAWLYESVRLSEGRGRWVGLAASALAVVAALALLRIPGETASPQSSASTGVESGISWQPFTPAKLAELRSAGKPVFIDFTADWCITCKVNERTALTSPEVKQAFDAQGIIALRGDWTRQDKDITRVLEANGRGGVPLYLYYPKSGGEAVVLPQILTVGGVVRALQGG
jgi:thiol:disulfide interchange protein DsbD